MTAIEREPPLEHEGRPVFAAADGRRERVLKRFGQVAAVLVALWLAALLAGAIGFGRLPGVPGSSFLQRSGHDSKASRQHAVGPVAGRPSAIAPGLGSVSGGRTVLGVVSRPPTNASRTRGSALTTDLNRSTKAARRGLRSSMTCWATAS